MKQGEIEYIKNIGCENALHALNKPYSDEKCGLYLIDIGSIIHLLPLPPAKLWIWVVEQVGQVYCLQKRDI